MELRNAIISTVVPPAVIESGSSAPSADSSTSQTEPYSIRMLRAVQNCFAHMLGCEVKAYTPDDIWANIRYAFSNSYSREKLRNCYNYSSITLLENSKFVERFVFCKETRFSFTSIFTTVCSESTVRARWMCTNSRTHSSSSIPLQMPSMKEWRYSHFLDCFIAISKVENPVHASSLLISYSLFFWKKNNEGCWYAHWTLKFFISNCSNLWFIFLINHPFRQSTPRNCSRISSVALSKIRRSARTVLTSKNSTRMSLK